MCVGSASAARSVIHDRNALITVAGPPSIDPHADSELCTSSKSDLNAPKLSSASRIFASLSRTSFRLARLNRRTTPSVILLVVNVIVFNLWFRLL